MTISTLEREFMHNGIVRTLSKLLVDTVNSVKINPVVVSNTLTDITRFPNASPLGTGVRTQSVEINGYGVKNGVLKMDGGKSVDYFVKGSPDYAFLSDRTDGYDKVYWQRSSQTNMITAYAVNVMSGAVGFKIEITQ